MMQSHQLAKASKDSMAIVWIMLSCACSCLPHRAVDVTGGSDVTAAPAEVEASDSRPSIGLAALFSEVLKLRAGALGESLAQHIGGGQLFLRD